MFGKKSKPDPGNAPSKRKGAELMSQMGFGMPTNMEDMEAMVYGDDDDEDLEAELAALTGGEVPKKASPKKKGPVPMSMIEQMASQSMKELGDDDSLSDTDDPDLLAELAELQNEDEDEEEEPPPPPPRHSSQQKHQPPPPPQHLQHQFQQPAPAPAPAPVAHPQARSAPQPSPSPSAQPQPAGGGDPVSVIQDRISMYQQALQNAKQVGDSSKQRRLDRGLKTLTDTLKRAKAGKPISEEDIPPPVAMGTSTPSPTDGPSSSVDSTSPAPPAPTRAPASVLPGPSHSQPGPSTSTSSDDSQKLMLETRKEQYRHAALAAKRSGDMPTASKYAKIAKQFDTVIHALEAGQPIDLTNMPPPLTQSPAAVCSVAARQPGSEVRVQRSAMQGTGEKGQQGQEEEAELPPEPTEEEAKKLFQAPDAPKSVMEALVQRLEKYKSSEDSAKQAGESSKARRMGRIVKQYEAAIKAHRAGQPVDFEELPTPPGFGPIPVGLSPAPKASPSPSSSQQQLRPAVSPSGQQAAAAAAAGGGGGGGGGRAGAPSPSQQAAQAPHQRQPPAAASASGAAAARGGAIARGASSRKSGFSRQEQQISFLRERMEEFKTAALQAKRNKDLEQAKQYIRMMKGMEPMIEACESGLPVDLSQVPPSPLDNEETEDKFVVVSAEDCEPTGNRDDLFAQLEKDLLKQMQTCSTNAQHFTKLGDVPACSKFQKMEQGCRRDLESLKSARRHGDPLPKFHYETRSFSIVQCNAELGDAEMEVTIVRGISYNLPSGYSEKDMDTMVKYEFGFPSEEAQTGHTSTVKDTINPEYNETFKLQIDRKSRSFARFVERKAIKLDVFLKRGFFKGDKLLGSAAVKLNPLETKCTMHDSFDLMEGRKSVGGKLEVKVRVRDPFKGRQVEESKEKWLVIDQFLRTAGSKSQAGQQPAAAKPKSSGKGQGRDTNNSQKQEGTTCMEVLRYEKQQLDKQISYLKDNLSAIQMQTLRHKSALLEEKLELQQKRLREGGTNAWKAYIEAVEKESVAFEAEARQLTRIGDVPKAETLMNKCKLARKELSAIKAKMQG